MSLFKSEGNVSSVTFCILETISFFTCLTVHINRKNILTCCQALCGGLRQDWISLTPTVKLACYSFSFVKIHSFM